MSNMLLGPIEWEINSSPFNHRAIHSSTLLPGARLVGQLIEPSFNTLSFTLSEFMTSLVSKLYKAFTPGAPDIPKPVRPLLASATSSLYVFTADPELPFPSTCNFGRRCWSLASVRCFWQAMILHTCICILKANQTRT